MKSSTLEPKPSSFVYQYNTLSNNKNHLCTSLCDLRYLCREKAILCNSEVEKQLER